jgi:putative transposase
LKQGKNKGNQCCKKKFGDEHFCKVHSKDTKLNINYDFLNRSVIRDAIITKDNDLDEDNIWQKEIPYDTRQYAIDQLLWVYSSNFALIKNRDNKDFNVSFKSKKATSEIFHIRKESINFEKMRIFSKRSKTHFRLRNRDLKSLKEQTSGIVTCLKTKPGYWYLCIPRVKKEPTIIESAPYKSVFLDPGVRTFQTFYSPDGICGKIGDEYSSKFIKPITEKIDSYESIRSKSKNWRTKRNLRNRLFKLRNRVRNKIQDLHWKTCKYLCDGFDYIFLPEFKSSEMVEKSPNRVISNKTVRQMLTLSHCDFRNKLEYYVKTKHRQLILVSEEYTTKTCGSCGKQNDVGSSKKYSCSCGYEMDRDIHGARNICIKILS